MNEELEEYIFANSENSTFPYKFVDDLMNREDFEAKTNQLVYEILCC